MKKLLLFFLLASFAPITNGMRFTKEEPAIFPVYGPDTLHDAVVIYQMQACWLDKHNKKFSKIFTHNLISCIGLLINSEDRIGCMHIDHNVDLYEIAPWICKTFSSSKDNPITIYINARKSVNQSVISRQGEIYNFNDQQNRIKVLLKKIKRYAKNRGHHVKIEMLYIAGSDKENLTYRNTFGITNTGLPFMAKIYPDEKLNAYETRLLKTIPNDENIQIHHIVGKITSNNNLRLVCEALMPMHEQKSIGLFKLQQIHQKILTESTAKLAHVLPLTTKQHIFVGKRLECPYHTIISANNCLPWQQQEDTILDYVWDESIL